MKRALKKVVEVLEVRQEVVADGVEVAAVVVAVVEAAGVEADAMVAAVDASQTKIIAKPRGNRANHAGRSCNRL
jgi:2-hydroxychromene-2-carboxylate isomerase